MRSLGRLGELAHHRSVGRATPLPTMSTEEASTELMLCAQGLFGAILVGIQAKLRVMQYETCRKLSRETKMIFIGVV